MFGAGVADAASAVYHGTQEALFQFISDTRRKL